MEQDLFSALTILYGSLWDVDDRLLEGSVLAQELLGCNLVIPAETLSNLEVGPVQLHGHSLDFLQELFQGLRSNTGIDSEGSHSGGTPVNLAWRFC